MLKQIPLVGMCIILLSITVVGFDLDALQDELIAAIPMNETSGTAIYTYDKDANKIYTGACTSAPDWKSPGVFLNGIGCDLGWSPDDIKMYEGFTVVMQNHNATTVSLDSDWGTYAGSSPYMQMYHEINSLRWSYSPSAYDAVRDPPIGAQWWSDRTCRVYQYDGSQADKGEHMYAFFNTTEVTGRSSNGDTSGNMTLTPHMYLGAQGSAFTPSRQNMDRFYVFGKNLTAEERLYACNQTTFPFIAEAPPSDTCTYTSGDWDIDCSDECVITTPTDLDGNDWNMRGSGTITVDSDIVTGWVKKYVQGGCTLYER